MDESLTIQRHLEQQQHRQEESLQYRRDSEEMVLQRSLNTFVSLEEREAFERQAVNSQKSMFQYYHLSTFQPGKTAETSQARRPDMEIKKERKAFYSEQKKRARTNEGGLLTEDEIENIELLRQSTWGQKTWMKEKRKGCDFTQEELYQQALMGDFSNFEHLDEPLRNALASRWMRQNFVMPRPGQTPGGYARNLAEQLGAEGLMHPLFRLGISLAMRSGFRDIPREYFVELDNKCCSEIMVLTLTRQISQSERERVADRLAGENPELQRDRNLAREAADAEIRRNQASQIFIAKNLLLMHLSQFTLRQKGKPDIDWPYDVAAAFGHCSRVSFVLPPIENRASHDELIHRKMWKALREVQPSRMDEMQGNACGMFRRASSTHGFQRRRVNRGKDGSGEFREQKKLFNLTGQEGMNVAIGGYMNRGINGRPILSDGSCGHIYFIQKEATAEKYGGYLIGFESDAYKKTNQLGHRHGFGNGEHASSFGGQRVDEIGDKYGGRVCDLGHVDYVKITDHLLKLERYMRAAMAEGVDTTPVMRILAGRHMDPESYEGFIRMIEMKTAEIEGSNPGRYAGNDAVFDHRRMQS